MSSVTEQVPLDGKRAYASPQLTVYGALIDLTATGSGGQSESANSTCMTETLKKLNTSCI